MIMLVCAMSLLILSYYLYNAIFYFSKLTMLEKYNVINSFWFGDKIFSFMIKYNSPYSASIFPKVNVFNKTECRIVIQENNNIMNCFDSVHAMALGNLGELTSGLVMLEYITNYNKKHPNKFLRGIVNKIECEYYKKARGVLTASCKIENRVENTLVTEIFNKNNDMVCKVSTRWDMKFYDKKQQ